MAGHQLSVTEGFECIFSSLSFIDLKTGGVRRRSTLINYVSSLWNLECVGDIFFLECTDIKKKVLAFVNKSIR